MVLTPPLPVPSPNEKGGGLGMGPTPPPHENITASETTAKEFTSSGRNEADHANGHMTRDESRLDVTSSIAHLLTTKQRTRVGFRNVRTLFHSGRPSQSISEVNNYNLAIMGITEARWTGAGKQRLNSGETIIRSWRQDNNHQDGVTLIIAS